jgi:hypothetical protein
VLQWDKDDCAAVGLVKFDLLGLGMLSALHYAVDFVPEISDIGKLKLDDAEVYDDALPGRLGGRVPGGEPGSDGHAAPAAGRGSSTTSWWRWR